MIHIPKLSNTGIISNNSKLALIGEKKGKPVSFDKYYCIYKRTKKKRIKKKQLKRSWTLRIREYINRSFGNKSINSLINGCEINEN